MLALNAKPYIRGLTTNPTLMRKAGVVNYRSFAREVLAQIADGRSNREIAHLLHVSEKTVKTHVSSVLAKLGVADRTQAAVLAVRDAQG